VKISIGQHRETRGGRLKFSPYLFSQDGIYNKFLLPNRRDLPQYGVTFAPKTFDFGFNASNPSLDPYDTQFQTITCTRNLLIWGITGTSSPAARGSAAVTPAFLFQVLHSHLGTQRQFFNKALTDQELAGTAQEPHLLIEPQLVLSGDQLTISMQNLGNLQLNAQVCLLGGEFD
jgi:hypothetical protein